MSALIRKDVGLVCEDWTLFQCLCEMTMWKFELTETRQIVIKAKQNNVTLFLKEAGGNYFEYIVYQHEVICMTVQ